MSNWPEESDKGERPELLSKERSKIYNPVEHGHAWTHGFLNQKPWHPLSFRNQIRKYEAEQKQIEDERKREASKKQFDLEQEHYKSMSYLDSKGMKDYKDRQELAFMYMKPPGLDAGTKHPPVLDEQEKAVEEKVESYKHKGHMVTMLKGQALCMENEHILHHGMSAPHGGIDPSAENQQLIFSESDESVTKKDKKRIKRHRLKEEVKQAEEILTAAGYDVKKINKHLRKQRKKKRQKH